MNFKTYHCSAGKAVPLKQYHCTEKTFVACINLPDGPNCDGCNEQIAFNNWAKENTLSCDESLSGEYPVEEFGPVVWQYEALKGKWITYNILRGNLKTYDEFYQFWHSGEIQTNTRYFLPLNEQSKVVNFDHLSINPNAHAIKVIKERIAELEQNKLSSERCKMRESAAAFKFAIEDYQNLLTILTTGKKQD